MDSVIDDHKAGFPHSEICGSRFVCQLPAAYRKLLRPSSRVIAKASTMCTLSLVSITLTSLARIRYTVEFALPYPKQSYFLRSLHILLITITTLPIIFGFNSNYWIYFLLFSRLLKNFYFYEPLKSKSNPFTFSKRFDLASFGGG